MSLELIPRKRTMRRKSHVFRLAQWYVLTPQPVYLTFPGQATRENPLFMLLGRLFFSTFSISSHTLWGCQKRASLWMDV